MKIISTFLGLVFAIYVAVRGIEFIQKEANELILFGICCLLLAAGLSYISVKSLLYKSRH